LGVNSNWDQQKKKKNQNGKEKFGSNIFSTFPFFFRVFTKVVVGFRDLSFRILSLAFGVFGFGRWGSQ
jgi:hypothetical protein